MRRHAFPATLVALALASAGAAAAQDPSRQADRAERLRADLAMPRPIRARDSVWIEELTWLEVRDAIASGKRTAIIPTGGVEQNGPYVATGKHNYVMLGACEGIARALGDALCAPVIKLVPEGSIEPKTGHMNYPGTLSLREETFEAVLEDVARSLAAHGFEHLVLIGDSGGNQAGMKAVAERLNAEWQRTVAYFVPEFYDVDDMIVYMNEELGIVEGDEGYHDFFWLTAIQMTVDPESVRWEERVAAGKASINGQSIADLAATLAIGEKLLQFRVDKTVRAIRAAMADPVTAP